MMLINLSLIEPCKEGIPPASTIKPAIGMYGLSNNIVSWDFEIKDPGFFTLPETGRVFRGWRKGGHGKVNYA